MSETDPRDDVPDSDAERAGIVDQQDAALAAIEAEEASSDEAADDDPMAGEAPTG